MMSQSETRWASTLGRIAAAVTLLAVAVPASASIVVFQDGRSLRVNSYKVEGEEAVVELAIGGSMRFPSGQVRSVAADEYVQASAPPPAPAAATSAAASPAGSWSRGLTAMTMTDARLQAVPGMGLRMAALTPHGQIAHLDARHVNYENTEIIEQPLADDMNTYPALDESQPAPFDITEAFAAPEPPSE